MKRLILVLALIASPALTYAQGLGSTSTGRTSGGGGAASAVTPGSTVVTGCTSQPLFSSSGSTLNCDTGFTYDASSNKLSVLGGTDATLSANMVTNGTFTGNATGWTLGGGGGAPDWAYASNNVTHASGGGTTALQPSTPLTVVASSWYVVAVTVSSYTSGTLTMAIGGTSGSSAIASNVTWVEVLQATNTGNLTLTPSNTFAATVDSVEAYLVTPTTPGLEIANGAATFDWEARTSGSGVGSIYIGHNAGLNAGAGATFNAAVGSLSQQSVTAGDFNSSLGTSALLRLSGTSGQNSAVGTSACRELRIGSNNVCVGMESGRNGNNFSNSTYVGFQAGINYSGSNNLCAGSISCSGTQAYEYVVALGYGAIPTASNQLVIGGNAASAGVSEGFIGSGVSKASPGNFALRGTQGSGSNNAGSNFTASSGAGTGTAAGGDYIIQRYPSIATGSTAQSGADGVYIRSQMKALTAATATAFARINLAQAVAGVNGWYGGTVFFTIVANTAAAAVVQTYVGNVNFACHNLAGAETCVFGTVSLPADNTPTGAITAPTFDGNAGTDTIDLRVSTDSDQAETTTLAMFWSVIGNGTGTITPQ